MRKIWLFRSTFFIMMFSALLTGCSNRIDKNVIDPINNVTDDPFEVTGDDTGILDAIGHGFANLEMDESGERRLPIYYTGGELEIEYYVNASGKAKNIGFLIFIEGRPQPYKFNSTEAPYEYMHIFDMEEDNKDMLFKFVFTPVTGKQGDTLDLNITSIYNPAFMPDMKETSSYGGYHSALSSFRSIVFEKDADALNTSNIPKREYISKVRQSTEPITEELLEKHEKHSAMKIDFETLEKLVISELNFEGDSAINLDNVQVNDSGVLHVTFKLFGHPGVRYQNTFYINHEALATRDGEISFETVLTKGEVAVIEVEIDLKRLDALNTFYVVSVPVNAEDFPNDVITLEKSRSILLYK